LSLIELNTTVITENRNKKLFSQGDPVDFCYFSLDGEVSIILEKESNSPSVGKKNKSYEK
jgi:CRP-like cAMP-binding protein